VLMLTLAGRAVGENWEELQHNLHYFDYVLALAIVGGVVWLVVRHRRRKRRLGMAISPAVADDGGE
jgi:membrane protein DedA with SNARE-associated domain